MINYTTLDFIKVNIVDSFVMHNKKGTGSGEAKIYIGTTRKRDWNDFFGNYQLKCFFDKYGLKDYLSSVEFEYKNPSQLYRRDDIKEKWLPNFQELDNYTERIYFNILSQTDNQMRLYIKSTNDIWEYLRRISIPKITTMFIQKILINNEIQLWFRLRLVGNNNDFENQLADEKTIQIETDKTISLTEKEHIVKSRIGQGRYRDLIIEKYKKCVITGIDDKRVLIASHIKPWELSDNTERMSQENGLLLSPTYDKLFDRGFISFNDTGRIMLSKYFSDKNFKRVGLSKGRIFNIQLTNEMKSFLEFHRDTVFIK